MRCLMTCAWRVTPETHQMQDSLVGRFSISCGSRSCFLAGQDEAIVQDESIVVCCKGFKQQFGNAFVQSRPTLLLLVSVCRWEQDNHLDPGVFGWSSTCKLAHVVASLDESPLIRSKATPVCLSIPKIRPPIEIPSYDSWPIQVCSTQDLVVTATQRLSAEERPTWRTLGIGSNRETGSWTLAGSRFVVGQNAHMVSSSWK